MELIIIIGIFIVLFSIPIIVINTLNHKNKMGIKEDYEDALYKLQHEPNNSKLKVTALELGRIYYSSLRFNKLLTIYDEQAINNDINSVCVSEVNSNNGETNDIYQDIEKLSKLKERGIITAYEYQEKKELLLSRIK